MEQKKQHESVGSSAEKKTKRTSDHKKTEKAESNLLLYNSDGVEIGRTATLIYCRGRSGTAKVSRVFLVEHGHVARLCATGEKTRSQNFLKVLIEQVVDEEIGCNV